MTTLPPPPPGTVTPTSDPEPKTEPARRSRWPLILALLALVALLGGGIGLFAWAFTGQIACDDGTFRSDRFGYCLEVPAGWQATGATDQEPVDRFQLLSAPGTVLVSAMPLSEGQDLAAFEAFVRSLEEAEGRTAGPGTATQVAGIAAVTFDVTAGEGSADDGVVSREVLFVRDGSAWRVQGADTTEAFEATSAIMEQMLATWEFV